MIEEPTTSIDPGGTLRFVVAAADGRRSVDWRVWTARNSDDAYVAARLVAGEIKVSLHESGSWQHGFVTDDKAGKHRPPGTPRHFAIWPRPPEMVPGWTLAMKMVVPASELQTRPSSGTLERPVIEIPAPPGHQAVVVEIWLEAAGDHAFLRLEESYLAGRLRQHGGGRVWVVSRAASLPWEPRQRFSPYTEAARKGAIRLKGWNGEDPMTICLHDPAVPNRELIYYEMAVPMVGDDQD